MLLFLAADSCYGATRAAFGKNKREAFSGGGHLVDNSPQALVLSSVLASLFVD